MTRILFQMLGLKIGDTCNGHKIGEAVSMRGGGQSETYKIIGRPRMQLIVDSLHDECYVLDTMTRVHLGITQRSEKWIQFQKAESEIRDRYAPLIKEKETESELVSKQVEGLYSERSEQIQKLRDDMFA